MTNLYNYISKAPCGKDLFVGQTHEKTAEQITQKILSSEESLMIGIDGSWGSGKSNLIQMIEKKMQEQKAESIFFTYDVWGHQNDMLRRSILEELTSKVIQFPQALLRDKREGWKAKEKDLLAQKKETSTKTIPKISVGILVLTLITTLTPLFSKIGELVSKTYSTGWDIGITAAPLAVGLGYAAYKLYHLEKKTSKAFLNELLSLYQERTKEETTHEVIFSAEPSSTQFRKWMKELDESLQTHLILVFDNMDRLPASKVQEFWAAIHSFFSEEQHKHIRVIIPFDRKHIISAFRSEDGDNKHCYGNDFIDKTFDIVYRVAPPTLSNWKGYLSDQWEKAFGEALAPGHSITQIYDLLTEGKTPREIVAFINECVTTIETCSASIPNEYIALFVIGKYKINESPKDELLALSFLEPLAYKYRNEETQKYLSALYYQLPPDEALDIIYTDQLRQELDKGENSLLQSLAGLPILSGLLENAIAAVTNIEHATLAFAQVENESNKRIPDNFWKQLLQKAPEENGRLKYYQIELLKHDIEEQSTKRLRAIIHSSYTQAYNLTGNSSGFINASQFYDDISLIRRNLKEYPSLNPMSLLHETKTTPDLFVRFVERAEDTYGEYKISCPMEEIDEYLSQMNFEELEDLDFIRHLPKGEKAKLNLFWQTLKSKIKNTSTADQATTLLRQWVDLGMRDTSSGRDPLMSDSLIQTLYENEDKCPFLEYCLICIYISRGKARMIPAMEDILREENEELYKEIAQKYIQIFITYEDLLLLHYDMGEYPLYKGIVKILILNKIGEHLSIEKVLPKYKDISQTFGVSLADVLTDWDRFKDSFAEKISEQTIQTIPVEFFRDTVEMQQLQIVSHCKQVAGKYLQSFNQEDWVNHFQEESTEYQLLISLNSDCPQGYEAFKQVVTTELSEQKIILSNETYEELVSLFSGQRKRWGSTLQMARDRYSEMGRNITPDLFLRYGTDLIKQGDLSQKPNAIPTLLPTVLLTNPETLVILNENSREVDLILSAAGEEYKQEFTNQARSIYLQETELSEKLTELIPALGIMPKAEEAETR